MMTFDELKSFYSGRKILVTGHTGFKGSWLCVLLNMLGADLHGYSLAPETEPALYELISSDLKIDSCIGDIRDFDKLKCFFDKVNPGLVIHMAAQPIVRDSYSRPRYTYETNVMGTVNILEVIRQNEHVRSFLNVTTDKVYFNNESGSGFTEEQPLDGYDPYSNSKSCSELVTHSYKASFFSDERCMISTARAGNVIGGGDFSKDRIIPDCVRAAISGNDIIVRNPYSIRPYQHVLEPLFVYLNILAEQYLNHGLSGWYNVGPDDCDCITTGELVDFFVKYWGNGVSRVDRSEANAVHEANFLKLDCSKLKKVFGWKPRWNVEEAVSRTVEWTKAWQNDMSVKTVMEKQIREFGERR